jgi:multidrug efflux pump subunit AcrB
MHHEAQISSRLGLAGRLAQSFINSPLTPLFLFAGLALGLFGLLLTPRQEDPQISVPIVDIFVNYPGASPRQVATLVAEPLERLMKEIAGVKHVYSTSQRDQALVTVQFEVGENLETSLVKLYDKLQSNLDKMPPGVAMPLVKPKGIDDVPVVTFTLWSTEVEAALLRLIALDVLQEISQVPNTAQGFVIGGQSQALRIAVLPERLAGFGIALTKVAEVVQAANQEQRVGNAEGGGQVFSVYSGEFLHSAKDVEALLLGVFDGLPVYVRDVAVVSEDIQETRQMVRYWPGAAYAQCHGCSGVPPVAGAEAVTLAIAKKPGSNGVTVANAVQAKMMSLKGRLLPDNVQVALTRDYGASAKHKVDELIFKLFVATGAVTLLVWLFLGWRAALVVVIVIPVVVLLTIFSAWLLGYTIDRVSLFALIFSIGILVDDAIVVVENLYRRWLEAGTTQETVAVTAVAEVGNPTILATFTVIAALLPMGFVSGLMGPYMQPIPALGSVAMVFSLLAAFIFAPWLAMRLRPTLAQLHRAEANEHAQNAFYERLFRGILPPLFHRPLLGWSFLAGIVLAFFLAVSLLLLTWVPVKMLPLDNKNEFNVVINFPEGTALAETANLTHALAEVLQTFPEVTAIQTYVGTASPFNFNGLVRKYYLRQDAWQADIQVQLLEKYDRKRSSHAIAQAARERLTPLAQAAGARIAIVEMPPGPPVLQTVVAEIYGPTPEIRRQMAAEVTEIFAQTPNIVDVDNFLRAPQTFFQFVIDKERAARSGVALPMIHQTLVLAMGEHSLGDIKRASVLEPTNIIIQVPLVVRSQLSRIGQLPVPSDDGGTVALRELGRFVPFVEEPPIYHKDLRALEYVTAEVSGRLAAPIYGMLALEKAFANYQTPDGGTLKTYYTGAPEDPWQSAIEWTGEWTVTYETFRDMGIAFAVALILIYMLVVWEFGNFVLPAIIMAPIPLTLIGIVPGHWLLGAEFTATSMIGFIALAGIIVRNSILLVDFSKRQVEAGLSVEEAVILACTTRTRPIVITALALVGGSFVILFDPIFQGMAVSLLFGVLVSTLLTLIVIPLGLLGAASALVPPSPPHNGSSAAATPPSATPNAEDPGNADTPASTTTASQEKPTVILPSTAVLGFFGGMTGSWWAAWRFWLADRLARAFPLLSGKSRKIPKKRGIRLDEDI